MPSKIYWIDHPGPRKLAIMARPRAGDWLEDEIDNWASEGIGMVVSLLEPEEIAELGLVSEAALCKMRGIDFLAFPIADRGVPADIANVVNLARLISQSGKATAVHCRAGVGRSSLIAAAMLMLDGISASAAFRLIAAARGVPVPDTDNQRAWVEALGAYLDDARTNPAPR